MRKNLRIVLAVLAIIFAISTGYLFNKVSSQKILAPESPDVEAKNLEAIVGKLIVLPIGETPTVATVSDPNALTSQAFFMNAKKGDRVLIYAKAKKAILYDPVLNKIINVAPLTTEGSKK